MSHPTPSPIAEALTRFGLAPAVTLFRLDGSAGLAIVHGVDGQVGLLQWERADAHLDAAALLNAIVWEPLGALILLAEEAETALGFAGVSPDGSLISTELRAIHDRTAS